MRNDAHSGGSKPQGRGAQRANRGFFPNSFKAISSYIRSATTVASNLRSAAVSSIAHSDSASPSNQVQWAGFDKLQLGENIVHHVLLLGFSNGFQVWDVEEADDIRELVSKQEGPVSFLQVQPTPIINEEIEDNFSAERPLVIVVTVEGNYTGISLQGNGPHGYGTSPQSGGNNIPTSVIRFYSLRNHSYIHTWRFRSTVYTVRCSPRVVAVALLAQIHCFDAATLESKFSVLTYPVPQGIQTAGASNIGYGPMALGPRWIAYAANHAVVPSAGRGSPQLTPSPGASPSTSPANGSLVAHYAKESGKQIAVSLVTLGDIGYKTLTKYYTELLPDGNNSPKSESPRWRNNCNGLTGQTGEADFAGTVVVRDYVGKFVISQFRAHSSPLSALCFDPSGTLLVTASVHGHSFNVFRIIPSQKGSFTGFDGSISYIHLYKLHRGFTDAIIQDISFSYDSHWILISSSHGTSHLFAISPFGGPVGLHTHEESLTNVSRVSTLIPSPKLCWYLGPRLSRPSHYPLPALMPSTPINLSVVSRIKNPNAGWRSTMTGAAAAATTGRACSSSGAIATVFHNGKYSTVKSDRSDFSSRKHLWIFFPTGHLIQYSLRLFNTMEGSYVSSAATGMAGRSFETNLDQDLKVTVDTVQKWDVLQVPNRTEREEDITNLCRDEILCSNAGRKGFGSSKTVVTNTIGNEAVRNKESNSEEKQHRHISKAEVQMHQATDPIWAKSEIYFHILIPDGLNQENSYGEAEIERFPTRVVEVRTQDLVPVSDYHSRSRDFQQNRNCGGEECYVCTFKDEAVEVPTDRRIDLSQKKIMNRVPLNGCNSYFQGLQQQRSVCQTSFSAPPCSQGPNITSGEMHINVNLTGMGEISPFQSYETSSEGCAMVNSESNMSGCENIRQENASSQVDSVSKFSSKDILGAIGKDGTRTVPGYDYELLNANIFVSENANCAESSRSSDSKSETLCHEGQMTNVSISRICKGDICGLSDTSRNYSGQALSQVEDTDADSSDNAKMKIQEGKIETIDDGDGWDESVFPFAVEE